jgi:hypothetical protein
MERNYEDRMQFTRSDEPHWEALRARAGLIDWRLLAIHVALIRRDRLNASGDFPAMYETASFIRGLAMEIVEYTGK